MVIAGAKRFLERSFVLYQRVPDVAATEGRVIDFSMKSNG
jgi:hypothetical protein